MNLWRECFIFIPVQWMRACCCCMDWCVFILFNIHAMKFTYIYIYIFFLDEAFVNWCVVLLHDYLLFIWDIQLFVYIYILAQLVEKESSSQPINFRKIFYGLARVYSCTSFYMSILYSIVVSVNRNCLLVLLTVDGSSKMRIPSGNVFVKWN